MIEGGQGNCEKHFLPYLVFGKHTSEQGNCEKHFLPYLVFGKHTGE